jgi:Domain of unknown function (DUF2382)
MTLPVSSRPDRPFSGSHPQVPGADDEAAGTLLAPPAAPRQLPLEAARAASGQGWAIRLPVRAEQVTIAKEVVVRELVVLRRSEVEDVARLDANVQREQLRVETEGQVEVSDSVSDDLDGGRRPGRGEGHGNVGSD